MADETIWVPLHAVSFELSRNRNWTVGDTVAEAVKRRPDFYADAAFPSPADRRLCIERNEIWSACWWIGIPPRMCVTHASSLALLSEALRAHDAEATAA